MILLAFFIVKFHALERIRERRIVQNEYQDGNRLKTLIDLQRESMRGLLTNISLCGMGMYMCYSALTEADNEAVFIRSQNMCVSYEQQDKYLGNYCCSVFVILIGCWNSLRYCNDTPYYEMCDRQDCCKECCTICVQECCGLLRGRYTS